MNSVRRVNRARRWSRLSARDARDGGLDRDPSAVLYLPSAQFPQNSVSLVIRADAPLEAILPAIRAAVRETDGAQPVPASGAWSSGSPKARNSRQAEHTSFSSCAGETSQQNGIETI